MDEKNKEEQQLTETLNKIQKKYIVLSGKGGVGKSTVAVNIAVGLTRKGFTVGLLDTDFHGPSISKMLNVIHHKARGTSNNTIEPCVLFNGKLKVMSVQFMLPEGNDSVIWRGPLKHSVIKQFLGMTEWGELDYLIIDSPPGTGDEPLSVAQSLTNSNGAIIVTTPQEVSTFDVKKSIDFCMKVNLPVFGIIENMAGFVCPHCKETTYIFGRDGGRKMAEEANIRFLGSIPLDPAVVESGDAGAAFISGEFDSPAYTAMSDVIAQL